MALELQIMFGTVMHARAKPRRNAFRYGIYYLACPLNQLAAMNDGWRFGVERPGLLGFYACDHGDRLGGDLEQWMRAILAQHAIPADGEITLVTMPRVLGYVFNPVSFWLCRDRAGDLRAVMCEVNNTFGESHNYLCAHADGRPIAPQDWLTGRKFFHVSPFMERDGFYRFRFVADGTSMHFQIDHHDEDGTLRLTTVLGGTLAPFNRANLRRAFWGYPLVTLKAIALIHWQAAKLFFKGVRYVPKPAQNAETLTRTADITKI